MNVETRFGRSFATFLWGASIEPRSYERGNTARNARMVREFIRLQLSHVHMNVETNAPASKTIRPVGASIEPRSYERGNARANPGTSKLFNASIEPRSYERGNQPVACKNCSTILASIEPRSYERGNVTIIAGRVAREDWLQLSHVHMNVETSRREVAPRGGVNASIEPRSYERGNSGLERGDARQFYRFN